MCSRVTFRPDPFPASNTAIVPHHMFKSDAQWSLMCTSLYIPIAGTAKYPMECSPLTTVIRSILPRTKKTKNKKNLIFT